MILTYMQVGIKACLARKDRRQLDGLESWLFLNFRPLGEEPNGYSGRARSPVWGAQPKPNGLKGFSQIQQWETVE